MTVQEIEQAIETLELCRQALEIQKDYVGAAEASALIIRYKNLLVG
ncbi:hypothetical protein ABEP17_06900 [Priestia flexa]